MNSRNGLEAPIETAVCNKNTNKPMCDQTRLKTGIHRQCDLPPGHLFDSEGDPRGASYD